MSFWDRINVFCHLHKLLKIPALCNARKFLVANFLGSTSFDDHCAHALSKLHPRIGTYIKSTSVNRLGSLSFRELEQSISTDSSSAAPPFALKKAFLASSPSVTMYRITNETLSKTCIPSQLIVSSRNASKNTNKTFNQLELFTSFTKY